MGKIYILNAPPNSGKDVIADHLVQKRGYHKEQFKTPLFVIAAAMLGLSLQRFMTLYQDREYKESKHPTIGMSIRELMIKISEDFVKPICGQNAFGVLAARRITQSDTHDDFVFSDGGFVKEIESLCDTFGKDTVVIIRIHRKGCNFENDSRKYITDKDADELGVRVHDFFNDEQPLPELFDDFEHFIDLAAELEVKYDLK